MSGWLASLTSLTTNFGAILPSLAQSESPNSATSNSATNAEDRSPSKKSRTKTKTKDAEILERITVVGTTSKLPEVPGSTALI